MQYYLLSNTFSSNSIQVKIENIKYVNKILFQDKILEIITLTENSIY